jgi:HD-GYP domain-containing protein (c-di-GMP phosphodiesterase class II)
MSAALTLEADQAAPQAAGDFIRVPIDAFRMQSGAGIDLYCLPPGGSTPMLYRSARLALAPDDLELLRQRGHIALYVLAKEFAAFEQILKESLTELLADESVPPESKFAVLQSAMAMEVDGAFRLAKCDRFVALSHRVAQQITSLCGENTLVPRKLFDMVQHDFYTFTHLTNVAGFAVLLAEQLGISDAAEREKIAVGGLLHDVGKKYIPTEVLCKPGKLTPEEWDLIKSHPVRGYEDLCDRHDLDHAQLMMVYQHHERLDGKGYPVGMTGDEIHPWARLLAVCDVFDALTSVRPYRKPVPWAQALRYLETNAGTHFDAEMVQCWTSTMLDN